MGLKISRHGRFPGNKNRRIAPKARPGFQPRNAMAAALYHNRKGREEREPQAPTVINLSNETVLDSAPIGTVVGRFFTDGYPAPTYTLDIDVDNKFEIVGDELRTTDTFTYPNFHFITVTATNSEGSTTDSFSILVSEAPAPLLANWNPKGSAVPVSSLVWLDFNMNIQFGTGNIILRHNPAGTWEDYEIFTLPGSIGTGPGTVSIEGNRLYIRPTVQMPNARPFAVRMWTTAIDGENGKSFAGIANDTTVFWTTETSGVVAPTDIVLDNYTVPENALVGALVAHAVANGTEPHTYTKTADPDNKFTVASDGVIRLAATVAYPAMHSVSIQALNAAGSFTKSFDITVTEVISGRAERGHQADQDEGTTFDFYVDHANGSDSNDGTSVAQAKATINAAMALHTPGTPRTIGILDTGRYVEQLSIPDDLFLYGYGTGKPKVDGSQPLTGAVPCVAGDEAVVGPRWANMYKVENYAKTNFVDDDPFNAHLIEDDVPLMIAMGRLPNPAYPDIEAYQFDWFTADQTITDGGSPELILGHQLAYLAANYTQAQIENCDVRFHRWPNGATRTPVASFDAAQSIVYLTDQTQQYETNQYKDQFCLVNLVPAILSGEWAFTDNGDGTVNLYFWPRVPANVNTAMRHSVFDTMIEARNTQNNGVVSLVVQNTAATQNLGSATPIRFDRGSGNTRLGPFTVHNCLVQNGYNKGDGYGGIYGRSHDDYVVTQNTVRTQRNAFGIFMGGGSFTTTEGRTERGLLDRNIVIDVDKSPLRIYGNYNNIIARNYLIAAGLFAHANKGNHYLGGSKTLWVDNVWFACSGYWTFQETDSQDFIRNYCPTNFNDGRAIADQNREDRFSYATVNDINGDAYILNNDLPPTLEAINRAAFNGIAALGNPGEDRVNFAVMNNMSYGIQVANEPNMIANGERRNVYTGGTKRDVTDVAHDYTTVYANPEVGDFSVLPTSPTRSMAAEPINNLPGTDGSINLLDRWPNYDFSQDGNGDPFDITNPPIGPFSNPDNIPDFTPVWVERPAITGNPVVGNTVGLTDGICMQTKNYQSPTYQWYRTDDNYLRPDGWELIPGATSRDYTCVAADEGKFPACIITTRGVSTQVVSLARCQSSYPISIGTLLTEVHNPVTNHPINNWIESPSFEADDTPLLVKFVSRMMTGSGAPGYAATIGDPGRPAGTGDPVTVEAGALANRTTYNAQLGYILSPGTGTKTLQLCTTVQATASLGAYVHPVTGLTGIGATSAVAGGTSTTSLPNNVDTTQANGIVLFMACRANTNNTPDPVQFANSTPLLSDGYSGELNSSNSALVDIGQVDSPAITNYAETFTWSTARTASCVCVELLSNGVIPPGTVDIMEAIGDFTNDDGNWTYTGTDAPSIISNAMTWNTSGATSFNRARRVNPAGRVICPENVDLTLTLDVRSMTSVSRFRVLFEAIDSSGGTVGTPTYVFDTNSGDVIPPSGEVVKAAVFTTPATTAFMEVTLEDVSGGTVMALEQVKIEYDSP